MAWRLLLCAVTGYFLGSVNGAILISRLRMHDDVRNSGSGNAGLTNFLRTYGGWTTSLVVLIDLGKVFAAYIVARWLVPEDVKLAGMLAGLFVQIGHILPCFFSFHGGKGILCSAGLALIMDWRVFAIAFPVFVLVFLTTRYVSLASMCAATLFAVLFVVFFHDRPAIYLMALAMAAIAVYQHRGNIQRLLHGQERKTHFHKSKNSEG